MQNNQIQWFYLAKNIVMLINIRYVKVTTIFRGRAEVQLQ